MPPMRRKLGDVIASFLTSSTFHFKIRRKLLYLPRSILSEALFKKYLRLYGNKITILSVTLNYIFGHISMKCFSLL